MLSEDFSMMNAYRYNYHIKKDVIEGFEYFLILFQRNCNCVHSDPHWIEAPIFLHLGYHWVCCFFL